MVAEIANHHRATPDRETWSTNSRHVANAPSAGVALRQARLDRGRGNPRRHGIGKLNLGKGSLIMGIRIRDREAFNALNASRKADRIRLANLLIGLGEYYGATIERRDQPANPGWRGQSIELMFKLNGVGATVTISNLHGGDHAIISWYNDYSGDIGRKCHDFTGLFNIAVGDRG